MKRSVLILMVGCMMWLLVGAASALADAGPHKMGAGLTPDTCAACHRAHTGQAPYLLKEKQEQLCFTCHGSSASGSALDAKDGVGYSEEGHSGTAGALRGGGFKYALINAGEAGVEKVTGPEGSHGIPTVEATIKTLPVSELQPATSSHSVNESSQTAWGSGAISATPTYGASINLTCGSCHDPHGNGNYRILRPVPTESGASTGVKIPEEPTPHVYTTTNYWASWSEKDPEFEYKISEWCATCHTRLLDGSKSATTNSGDAVFTYRHRTNYTLEEWTKSPPKLGAGGGYAGAKPSCIQCHVAHGTNATMGEHSESVTLPGQTTNPSREIERVKGSGKITEILEDSYLLRLNNRGVCQTCHNK
jgi:predicted CXXCH cytochrome family protein